MPQPDLVQLSQALSDTQTALNLVWTVFAAVLVMFMQAGFAMVETGLVRAKNAAHTMAMNFLVYSIGILGYWALGFGLQMGGVDSVASLGFHNPAAHEFTLSIADKPFGLFGTSGFFLPPSSFAPGMAALFFFQMVFMDTTATIPTGALAERWKLVSFVLFSFCIATVIYPVYGNWVWGGGFLSQLGKNFGLGHGHVDFAGSSVVHLTGGVIALVTARMLGPRKGKYAADGTAQAIPAHNVPLFVSGTFVLAFGWFGFNAGSTLSAVDTRFAVVAVNTMLASATGTFVAYLHTWRRFGKPDVSMMCNGMLAGLVAITAPCAFVSSLSALLIGAVAALLVIEATLYVEHVLKIDDPVGAISVHGVNGMWGIVALGLFADGTYGDGLNGVTGPVRGLFYGDAGQFFASCIGIACNVLYVASVSALLFYVVGRLVGNRVAEHEETQGLDLSEMGMEGYAVEQGHSVPMLGAQGAYAYDETERGRVPSSSEPPQPARLMSSVWGSQD
jgi:Amt family ammonium transporter